MQRAPMLNSTAGFHRFNDGDFDRDDRFRRINRVIVIDNFAFPFFASFPFYYPYPYPYPYYGYPYGAYNSYGYGANYGGHGAGGFPVVSVKLTVLTVVYLSCNGQGVIRPGTRFSILHILETLVWSVFFTLLHAMLLILGL